MNVSLSLDQLNNGELINYCSAWRASSTGLYGELAVAVRTAAHQVAVAAAETIARFHSASTDEILLLTIDDHNSRLAIVSLYSLSSAVVAEGGRAAVEQSFFH